jgi:hypothetical protein
VQDFFHPQYSRELRWCEQHGSSIIEDNPLPIKYGTMENPRVNWWSGKSRRIVDSLLGIFLYFREEKTLQSGLCALPKLWICPFPSSNNVKWSFMATFMFGCLTGWDSPAPVKKSIKRVVPTVNKNPCIGSMNDLGSNKIACGSVCFCFLLHWLSKIFQDV